MADKLKVGDQIRQTHVRLRNMDDFESYIKAIDKGYEGEDANFNGYIYRRDALQFNLVNGSQCGNG